jgi:hypothetical protein
MKKPMLVNTIYIIFLTLFVAFIGMLYDCAHNVPPSGGPPDKTPPEIIYHFPAADSVGIKNLKYIEMEFSESIRKTTLPNNFWIMPEIRGEIKINWKGSRKVRFLLPDSLEPDQTYVFTLSTGITDMHNNRLTAPFQLAFSTGDKLDQGSIQGQIYAEKIPRDVYVNAYLMTEDENSDSLLNERPRYYTQIDEKGFYRLNYLSLNKFRVIALQDQNYDERYTMESDLIGIPFTDIVLDSLQPHFNELNFYLIREDTTTPAISRIDTISNREILIEFKEPVVLESFFSVRIKDSLQNAAYSILGSSQDYKNHSLLHLFFTQLPSQKDLTVQLTGIGDYSGNTVISDTLKANFISAARADTVKPRLLGIKPSRGSTNVTFNDSIRLSFNVPVDTTLFRRYLTLQKKEGDTLSGHYDFADLRSPAYIPVHSLLSATEYLIHINLDSVKDIWDRAFPDTQITVEFTTRDMADLGEISGTVRSPEVNWQQAIVQAMPLRGKEQYHTLAKKDSTYMLNFLPDGQYMTRSVLDLNENGDWDKGSTHPWHYSEPFIINPDTVKVRKRWTTQGINFRFNFRGKR